MGITLKDIAKKSGFGYGTVARALSDNPSLVKEETRQRIVSVAEKMGYVKNFSAQALVSGKTGDIGLVIPAVFGSIFYNDFYIKIIAGIMEEFVDKPYQLRVMFLKTEEDLPKLFQDVRSFRLHGLILTPYIQDFVIPEETIKQIKIPTVVLTWEIKGPNVSSVILDDRRGGYEGAEYLIKLGHRRIAVIRGFMKDIEERYAGWREAMKKYGVAIREEYIKKGDALAGSGREITKHLLGLKNPPTAIFALDDEMAFGALAAAAEKKVDCPRDISILGFDGIPAGEYTRPPLTTMARPVDEMGKRAVRMIMEGRSGVCEKIRARIHERGSCLGP